MSAFLNTYLYQPILSVLIFIYRYFSFHDLGIAIIFLTILVRIVLLPVFYKGAKDQALMQRLQPHIKKIQLDHKDDKEKQARAMMALYKKHHLNPFSGFLILLVQLPIFIVLFRIFNQELSNVVFDNRLFLGLIDLGVKSLVLTVIAAILQYIQGKISLPVQNSKIPPDKSNPLASSGKFMVYIGPVLTLVVLMNLPSALGLYWITSTVFSIAQQFYINKKLPKVED